MYMYNYGMFWDTYRPTVYEKAYSHILAMLSHNTAYADYIW